MHIKKQKKTLVLELESNSKKPIQLRIKKKHLNYFKGIELDELVNQEVIVSGTLKNKKGKRTIYLNHSTQLERVTAIKKGRKSGPSTIKWSTEK